MKRHSILFRCAPVAIFLCSVSALHAVDAEGVTENKDRVQQLKPEIRDSSTAPADTAEAAMKGFQRAKIPEGFTGSLWAHEPLLANPVAFSFDGKGSMYVAETFRYRTSVLDIRHYMFMVEDDLANRNQADWERSIKKNFPKDWQELGKQSEVVRLVQDTDNDGKADKTTVYADGFNSIIDGIASGVLARPEGVWLTNIPGLYKLSGSDAAGKAVTKEEVLRGFGVRFNYTGHDLHGLIKGPDGRIYFSIGDRGASVKTKEGTMVELPDDGAIYRCEEDGSHLEVVMRGLRNPQELAFDNHGNLFTGDNDSDQSDRERLVYVVEGADAGWRVGFQHCPQPLERNPWIAEHVWEPREAAKNQPEYVLSPLVNLPDGPGGLTHYPGTGLPEKYQGCFFLACYKGTSATSQVAVFKPVENGASFKLEFIESFVPGCQATDVDFGPDSNLYVSFWDEGWESTAQGRILKVEHANARAAQAAQIADVKKLLGDGFTNHNEEKLATLLSHADQRIRSEAHWELAKRAMGEKGDSSKAVILKTISSSKNQLARLHALWAYGQVLRSAEGSTCDASPNTLFDDPDVEVRAAWTRILAQQRLPFSTDLQTRVIALLSDASPRVRLVAAQALGKHGDASVAEELLKLAAREKAISLELRAAIGVALGQLFVRDASCTQALHKLDRSREEMLALLRAAAHLMSNSHQPEPVQAARKLLEHALKKEDLSLEAARLINDFQLNDANSLLAAQVGTPGSIAFQLRALHATFRRGGEASAVALVQYANDASFDLGLREQALQFLSQWAAPSQRDQVTGNFRPLKPHPKDEAIAALSPQAAALLDADPRLAAATLTAIEQLAATSLAGQIQSLALNASAPAEIRAQAVRTLSSLKASSLAETLAKLIIDNNSTVRIAAAGLLGLSDPVAAAKGLSAALANGTPEDARNAYIELGKLKHSDVDAVLVAELGKLTAGKVSASARLELLEAASARDVAQVKAAVASYEAGLSKDNPIAAFDMCLEGGDPLVGRKVYSEHPVAACRRCHQINRSGGEAGPALDEIGIKKDRAYLLRSIIDPNADIAETFRLVVVTLNDGKVVPGVIQSESEKSITLGMPSEASQTVERSAIKSIENVPSGMMPGLGQLLTKRELRDLVAFLVSLDKPMDPIRPVSETKPN